GLGLESRLDPHGSDDAGDGWIRGDASDPVGHAHAPYSDRRLLGLAARFRDPARVRSRSRCVSIQVRLAQGADFHGARAAAARESRGRLQSRVLIRSLLRRTSWPTPFALFA